MRVAIIGCGVAGLSAAHELQRHNIDVKLYDKSRGVGGRMSTRYADLWEFDHGAQFFTVQDEGFRTAIDDAISAGVVAPWDAKAIYLKEGELSDDQGRKRFVGKPRMNSLAKYWSQGLDVALERHVTSVFKSDKWALIFEDGSIVEGFDGVISTLPPAQAKNILPDNFGGAQSVLSSKMHVCFCVMVGLDAPIDLGWDTLRVKDLPIDWISINNTKPGRSESMGTVVIHSESAWSDTHAGANQEWVKDVMLESASALMGISLARQPHVALHRWLYASSKSSPDVPCIGENGFVVAGDWCLGGRVQSAWMSGRAAARVFLEK